MTRTHAPRRRRGRRATALATLAIASLGLVAGLAPAAVAQQSDTQTQEGHGPRGPRLTDEQKACLEEQGIEKPATDENGKRVKPTEEQREQFEAAAEACGIDLPLRRPRLTDEQKACLEEQGIEKPATDENGKRVKPTEEQREQFEAAAEACGIDLPRRGPRLTDEQKACLEEQGIEKPATDENGKRVEPTEEQREQFEAAAQACGIDLPERPAGGGDQAPSDTPADGGDTST